MSAWTLTHDHPMRVRSPLKLDPSLRQARSVRQYSEIRICPLCSTAAVKNSFPDFKSNSRAPTPSLFPISYAFVTPTH
jgi:hypothetical protein